jgi:UDP-N-acetylmuramoyl-tripeptide--D-alanyl-D-alanine ligase
MNALSIDDLVKTTGGPLRLAAMPPIDGKFAVLGRSVGHSSLVRPGDLYWDFPDSKHRNSLIEEAFARGARGVVSERAVEPWAGGFSVQVRCALTAIEQLVAAASSRFGGIAIGVMGPCGKTIVGELIHQVLGHTFRGQEPARGDQSLLDGGDPLHTRFWTHAASLSTGTEFAVIEFPDSDTATLTRQLAAVSPKILILTGWPVGVDPLAFTSALSPDTWLFASGDDVASRRCLARRERTIWYGRDGDNDVVPQRVQAEDDSLAVLVDGIDLRLPVHGRQYVDAALAALAVGKLFALSAEDIASAMAHFACPRHRCEVVKTGEWIVVNDSSKVARSTLLASFDAAREMSSPGRRIVVLGGLEQQGELATHQIAREAGQAAVTRCGAHLLVVCGEEGTVVREAALAAGMPEHRVRAVAEPLHAVEIVRQWARPGDVVLVKGQPEEVFSTVADQLIASAY